MIKRVFDVVLSIIGLLLFGWIVLLCCVIAAIDTGSNGIFLQERIGRYGKIFTIFKLRTMHIKSGVISRTGRFLRKKKLDELPQLWNVLTGDMSFVGPRPDIPGYYDGLKGEDRRVLNLRPGITGPASLKYFDEEEILESVPDAQRYNDEVIFPDKVKINLQYEKEKSLWLDLKIIFLTLAR
jgi:lipopolysaccharide/colanic/teichoic acid biosynthesis glycosyltransferase